MSTPQEQVSVGTVVAVTENCQIVRDGYGFYVRCTSPNCTYTSEHSHSKSAARRWAEIHEAS